MPLLMASPLLGMLETFRVLTFDGRYGGGKSALCYRLAYHLLSSGRFRYLLSNCRSVWTDKPGDVEWRKNDAGEEQYLDCVVILDEAGLFLKVSKDTDDYLAFLRKMNVVLLCPSVSEVARSLRGVVVQRQLNLQVLGLPLWIYQYKLSKGMQKETASFAWWYPQEIFGIYDSSAMPIDDGGIGDWLADRTAILAEREREKQHAEGIRYLSERKRARLEQSEAEQISRVESGGGDDFERAVEDFAAIAESVEYTTNRFEAISKKRRK